MMRFVQGIQLQAPFCTKKALKSQPQNAKDNKEQTALSLAKEQVHDEIVEFFLKRGNKE